MHLYKIKTFIINLLNVVTFETRVKMSSIFFLNKLIELIFVSVLCSIFLNHNIIKLFFKLPKKKLICRLASDKIFESIKK